MERGLDSGTAFQILSIDIADVDVGDNVEAKLQADQAEADLRRAHASPAGPRLERCPRTEMRSRGRLEPSSYRKQIEAIAEVHRKGSPGNHGLLASQHSGRHANAQLVRHFRERQTRRPPSPPNRRLRADGGAFP
ncbi:MAG: flotillin-like FloA family protein [Planctomycetota bacterium]